MHHTNIVPVFEVGSANGQHYYTMQFISGVSLDDLIRQIGLLRGGDECRIDTKGTNAVLASTTPPASSATQRHQATNDVVDSDREFCEQVALSLFEPTSSDDSRKLKKSDYNNASDSGFRQTSHSSIQRGNPFFYHVADIGFQAANALEYAHQHKTLHRDIKPANLLLDADTTVWVVDFGLASKDDEDGLTLTGDVVGTLRYMAPERFEGFADARSDIFSLGLTLYELATLKCAFNATDRASLVKQLTSQDPTLPRSIEPQIPKDLETIIVKSIERNPNHRYQTAGAMAEDLRLFIMGHPIRARRISPIERVWRICRRNPVASSLAAMLVLSLMVMTIGAVWFANSSHQKTVRAKAAEQAEKRNSYRLHLQRADTLQRSLDVGRRYDSLKSIRAAVDLIPEMDFELQELGFQQTTLRSQAIASLALFDVDEEQKWPVIEGWSPTVAFTPDYEFYAQSHQTRGEILVRNTSGKVAERQISHAFGAASLLRFSLDGKFLFSQHRHSTKPARKHLCVWKLEDDATSRDVPFLHIESHGDAIAAFSVRAEVALCEQTAVTIYSLENAKALCTTTLDFIPGQVVFAEDRKQIAITEILSHQIEIWDYSIVPRRLHQLDFPQHDRLRSLAWSSGNRLLVAGLYGGGVLVWRDFESPPQRFQIHEGTVVLANIHPNGRYLFTQAWDDTVRVFDLSTEKSLLLLDRYELPLGEFSAAGDRRAFYSVDDRSFGVWRMPRSPLKVMKLDLAGVPAALTNRSLDIHPKEQTVVATTTANRIEFWDIEHATKMGSWNGEQLRTVRFTPNGESIVVSSVRGLTQYELSLKRRERANSLREVSVEAPQLLIEGNCRDFLFTPDGESIIVMVDGTVKRLARKDLNTETVYGNHSGLSSISASPDGRWVATGAWRGRGVRVWDAKNGELVRELLPEVVGTRPKFSADGGMLVVAATDSIHIFRCGTWKEIPHEAQRHSGVMGDVAFSNDSRYVIMNKTRYLPQLIDLRNGRQVAEMSLPLRDVIRQYAFSNDDQRIVVLSSKYLLSWDLKDLKAQLRQLRLF